MYGYNHPSNPVPSFASAASPGSQFLHLACMSVSPRRPSFAIGQRGPGSAVPGNELALLQPPSYPSTLALQSSSIFSCFNHHRVQAAVHCSSELPFSVCWRRHIKEAVRGLQRRGYTRRPALTGHQDGYRVEAAVAVMRHSPETGIGRRLLLSYDDTIEGSNLAPSSWLSSLGGCSPSELINPRLFRINEGHATIEIASKHIPDLLHPISLRRMRQDMRAGGFAAHAILFHWTERAENWKADVKSDSTTLITDYCAASFGATLVTRSSSLLLVAPRLWFPGLG